MIRLGTALAGVVALATIAVPSPAAAQGAPASGATRFVIDSVHSSVVFRVRHLGISTVTGRFHSFSGSFDFDSANVERSSVTARIATASIDTDNPRRDADLRSSNYLAVDSFPEMTFASRRVESAGPGRFRIIGDLTLHGLTREVTLDAELTGMVTTRRGTVVAFSASTTVSRRDFGMTFSPFIEGIRVVGDEVRISIEVEARAAES